MEFARITQQGIIQLGRMTTEGDELYYEVRGQRQLLLMILPGGCDEDFYAAVAQCLAQSGSSKPVKRKFS